MHPKITICVAVYNPGEYYLKRCLNSIISQTLKEIEIIIVNDGSTDNSIDILREYAAHDKRIKLINQNNQGLSMARKVGVEKATGEYIGFVDNDDFIELTMFEEMYITAKENNVDIVEVSLFKGKNIISSIYEGKKNTKTVLKEFLKYTNNSMLWMRIYKKGIINPRVFPTKHIINNEDVFAYPCILYSADTIYYLKIPLYHYNIDNNASVMKRSNKSTLSRYNILRTYLDYAPKHVEDFIGKNEINIEYYSQFNAYIIGYILRVLQYPYQNYNYRITDVCNILKTSITDLERTIIQSVKNHELPISTISEWLIRIIGLKKWIILSMIRSRI